MPIPCSVTEPTLISIGLYWQHVQELSASWPRILTVYRHTDPAARSGDSAAARRTSAGLLAALRPLQQSSWRVKTHLVVSLASPVGSYFTVLTSKHIIEIMVTRLRSRSKLSGLNHLPLRQLLTGGSAILR